MRASIAMALSSTMAKAFDLSAHSVEKEVGTTPR